MNNLLSANAVGGLIGLVALFLLCFFGVHIYLYFLSKKKQPPPEPPPTPPQEAEPIYYIVEKKKRRVKEDYSPPKRIDFK